MEWRGAVHLGCQIIETDGKWEMPGGSWGATKQSVHCFFANKVKKSYHNYQNDSSGGGNGGKVLQLKWY